MPWRICVKIYCCSAISWGISARVRKPFPQEAELAAKSARLAELNAQLDMGAQRKPASRERGMVKSSRPSVLEGLKRPAPPRTAEKKHQEEVR